MEVRSVQPLAVNGLKIDAEKNKGGYHGHQYGTTRLGKATEDHTNQLGLTPQGRDSKHNF